MFVYYYFLHIASKGDFLRNWSNLRFLDFGKQIQKLDKPKTLVSTKLHFVQVLFLLSSLLQLIGGDFSFITFIQ